MRNERVKLYFEFSGLNQFDFYLLFFQNIFGGKQILISFAPR